MLDCPCQTTDALCDACLDSRWAQLRGVAARRGEVLGRKLARAPQPLDQVLLIEAVRTAVADMSRDRRLLARIELYALEWARRTSQA